MIARVLEPEVMDTPEEARDYDAMDHAAVNARFCQDFLAFATAPGRPPIDAMSPPLVIDFGTGTALIPVDLCACAAGFAVIAIDLSEHMIARGRVNVAHAGLANRVLFERVDAKRTPFDDGAFGATISNSIVHHMPDPERGFAEMLRVTAKGGVLFVRDLHRPESDVDLERLVTLHGGQQPADPALAASFERQRDLLRASLRAALTATEVAEMLAPLGVPPSAVRMTSDRHWTLAYEKP